MLCVDISYDSAVCKIGVAVGRYYLKLSLLKTLDMYSYYQMHQIQTM